MQTQQRWNVTYSPQLDGLRAVAVLLVVGYHVLRNAAGPLVPGAFLGVDVFFVLSGFLITSLLLKEQRRTGRVQLVAFYRRRFWRLYPCLVLVCAVTAVWYLAVPQPEAEVATAVRDTLYGALFALTYIASWAFAFDLPTGVLGHAWSLSVEEHFYVIWPLLFLVLVRRQRAHLLRWTALLTALAAAWPLALRFLTDPTRDRLYAGPDTRCSQLLVGCTLALLLGRTQGLGRLRALASPWAVVGAGLVFAVALLSWHRKGEAYLTGGQHLLSVSAAILIAHLVTSDGRLTRLLSWRPAVAVGQWSYGIYLWHLPLMTAPYAWLGVGGWSRLLGGALALPVAALSFRYVEQPLLRRYGRQRPAPRLTTSRIIVAPQRPVTTGSRPG